MGARQFIDTISQIVNAEHMPWWVGITRHLGWEFRRLSGGFPVDLKVSESVFRIYHPSGVGSLLNCLGVYDYNNMNFIRWVLRQKEKGVFFDVGANIGSYTLIASEIETALVVAFEPHPETFQRLKENVEINGRKRIILRNTAISDQCGYGFLTNEKECSTLNRLVEKKEETRNAIRVRLETLDKVCEEMPLMPTILKIDVEGSEEKVLRGFKRNIGQTGIILVEGGTRGTIVSYLNKHGFLGPYFVFFQDRRLKRTVQRRPEDPIFLTREYRTWLENLGIRLEG